MTRSKTWTPSSLVTARRGPWPIFKEYIAFNREFVNDVGAAKKAGKSVDEVAAS
jgi:hypothetical protein